MRIFEYNDYRRYLRDHFEEQKKKNPSYSFAVFARMAGLPSRAHAKIVMDGQRDLSLKTIPLFSRGLKLTRAEARYFEVLVQFNQARSSELQSRLYEQLLAFPQRRRAHSMAEAQHRYYSKWYYAVIREIVTLETFPQAAGDRPSWISRLLRQRITPAQAHKALDELVLMGLLVPQPDGRLTQASTHIQSTDEVSDFALKDFHRHMIGLGLESFDQPLASREFAGLTLAVRKDDLPRAKEAIKAFRRAFNFDFTAPDQTGQAVYQLNIQLIDLTDGRPAGAAVAKTWQPQTEPKTKEPT